MMKMNLQLFAHKKGGSTMGIEDKLNQVKGALKEGAGKLSGDKKTQAEGAVEKVVAKAKDGFEDVKDSVEGAVEGLKNSFKK